mmetsp:Transcript_19754/g.67278  ORF Transcript_19754/g.67278 Transcript_19754/m.67278 type:complete len:327 (-) Transcript_19754:276-1256(-)
MAESEDPAERLQWLREHGVEVTAPKGREHELPKPTAATPVHFTVVRVPCDDSEPLEEVELVSMCGGDQAPELLKSRFTSGRVDQDVLRQQSALQFGAKASGVSAGAIDEVTAGGSVETFALTRPAQSNGMRGVYAYIDEVGMLKKLPRNSRADGLAKEAGFDGVAFYGDVYVGRVRTDVSPMRNEPFGAHELSSGAEWLRRAVSENIDYQAGLSEFHDAAGVQRLDAGGAPPEGQGEGYQWTQEDEDVEVVVQLPESTTKRDVKVKFEARGVHVEGPGGFSKTLLPLHAAVRRDGCSWTLAPGGALTLTLEKVDEQPWPDLLAPEA